MRAVEHRRFGRTLRFDDDGIHLLRVFRRPVHVPWSAVAFISPTPAVEVVDKVWRIKPALLPHASADLMVFDIVVALDAVAGLALPVQALVHSPGCGIWSEDLHTAALSSSREALLALVFTHCRQELLCYDV
jgi:hypothetical protein